MPNSADAAGAGPSASIRLDGECQDERSPASLKACTARWISAASGRGVLRPKLRLTEVPGPAGPRSVERLIALISVGGGFAIAFVIPLCWSAVAGGVPHAQAAARSTRRTTRAFTRR